MRSIRHRANNFQLRDGALYLKETTRQWISDKANQDQILQTCHDNQ